MAEQPPIKAETFSRRKSQKENFIGRNIEQLQEKVPLFVVQSVQEKFLRKDEGGRGGGSGMMKTIGLQSFGKEKFYRVNLFRA